jgi:hypothetical protein
MKLEVTREQLSQKKLFIGMPCYGGQMMGMCAKSCLDLQGMCQQFGIESRFSFIFNESLITRARNYLVDEFVRSDFTHLLFIDSDIHFDPKDVIALLAIDKDVIGAPYPKKSIKWWAIKEAIIKNPEIQASDLEKLVGDYVFNAVGGTGQFQVNEPCEVMEIGTGYMMIKRRVFDLFKATYPEKAYRPDHIGQQHFDGSRHIHAYFDCYIDRGPGMGQSERYLSEDYAFCQLCRKIPNPEAPGENLKIWLCPWMRTHHIGTYAFTGDLPAVAGLLGKL